MADKSEFGREMVDQYEADELALNSEDDKHIYRSERRPDKKHKVKKKGNLLLSDLVFLPPVHFSAAYPISFSCLEQRSATIILGSLLCLQEIWSSSNQVPPKGSFSANKPQRCKAQVLRMYSGTPVDSDKCLFQGF